VTISRPTDPNTPAFNHFDVVGGTESHFLNMTLTNGSSPTDGGAIHDHGTLQLQSCTFANNSAAGVGGAIMVASDGTARMSDCTFEYNSAAGDGGAIAAEEESLATSITNCILTENSAGGNGGAISAISAGSLYISGCMITFNSADGVLLNQGFGGGVYVDRVASATISSTDITDNTAAIQGGGLYVIDCDLTMTDGRLSYNTAAQDGGGFYIDAAGKTVTLNQVKVTDNKATNGKGGGGYILNGTLAGSLAELTGNTAGAAVLPLPGIGVKAGATATITVPANEQTVGDDL
jgi:predicted outer membrane repeat protein